MMVSRGLFGWSPPHIQPLTPVSEVSEPPESPSPYLESNTETVPVDGEEDMEELEEIEPPAAVPFLRLFACADRFDWFLMVIGSLAAAAHGTALVLYLHYFTKIIQLIWHQGEELDQLFHRFTELVLTIVYIAAGVFAVAWIEISCWILTGERQTAVIRSKYVEVLLSQDMSFFDTYANNGDIVSQVLSDVLLIQSALSEKVGNYIHNMATFFSGLVVGLVSCWQIALLTLITGPVIVAAGGISNVFLHRLAESIQDAYAEAASIAEQAVSYVKTLYAFTNETLAKYSYATSLQATLRYGILISLVQGLGLGFTYGLAICSCALQLWVGWHLLVHKNVQGGEIVISLFAIILSALGLNQAATNSYAFEQGRIAAYRLFEMISRSSSAINSDGRVLVSVQGNIEFRNVYFSYPSRPEIPILSGFYLTVPAKKTVALVGRNGSGKSSIIPLMQRFYDPTLGEILLDGENINGLKLEWLRGQMGLVTQEPALLSLNIRDNISYGRPNATFDQIEEAAKMARAHTYISSLQKGYSTRVGRDGVSLPEEQKIKLSIARAVLMNPSILLLDEITGGLDFDAERAMQETLDLITFGRSTIIIAQHPSVIKSVDCIAVMDEGQLVEFGTHEELLGSDGLYAELLRCDEATRVPRRMAMSHWDKEGHGVDGFQQESIYAKMMKSPSLQRLPAVHALHVDDNSPKLMSPPPEVVFDETDREPLSISRQDSFEKRLPELPKLDVHQGNRQSSAASDPESPVSPLLTSDPKSERSHSQTFCRPLGPHGSKDEAEFRPGVPSFWRLAKLSFTEWFYAAIGSVGAAIFGAFNPLFAYIVAMIVMAYHRYGEQRGSRHEVDRWCLVIACMGIVTIFANFLQHFYFGIMGEKMTERVRRMMFSAMLRNEVGWFEVEENSADALSMRLANDATFVRAAFSNRLSIFIQDVAAILVAITIGLVLEWRLALVAMATIPILMVSAVAQKMWLGGFSRGIQETHRKAALILEDAVRNVHTVVAFCGGAEVVGLYRLQLGKILMQSLIHGMAIGVGFGFSQFLLFGCNALLLWYAAIAVRDRHADVPTVIKEYMVFSFATFALVEPFGLAPYILKRRRSLVSVFEIIDRDPEIDPDDESALKLPNVFGTIELRDVSFCYAAAPNPSVFVLSDISFRIGGGQTVAVVGSSGSGKSTIMSLVERFYDPVMGRVLLDGRDLRTLNLRWLRSHLGLVQQEPVIFSTTVRENIIYARHNASEAEMKEAARIANAHHFISSLPHGYDTHIGVRGGVELTPGQRQRISIARVVLKNAPILLVDEVSAMVELESSRAVQEALDTLVMGNKTTLLVTRRAAMMRHVDNILVLSSGRIVEEGTHDALLAKNGLYVRLMQPHFAKNVRPNRFA